MEVNSGGYLPSGEVNNYHSSPTLRWIIVLVYTKQVDSQHQIVPFLWEWKANLAREVQKHAGGGGGYQMLSRAWVANQSARKTLSTGLVYTNSQYPACTSWHYLSPRVYWEIRKLPISRDWERMCAEGSQGQWNHFPPTFAYFEFQNLSLELPARQFAVPFHWNHTTYVWGDGVGCTWYYVYILTTDEYPPCARGESGERYQRAPTRKENGAMTDAQHEKRDLVPAVYCDPRGICENIILKRFELN